MRYCHKQIYLLFTFGACLSVLSAQKGLASLYAIVNTPQNEANTWQMGLYGGVAQPLKSYGEYTSRALGNAAIGYWGGIGTSYNIHPRLALTADIGYLQNPLDANKTAAGIWEEDKTASSVKLTASPYRLYTFTLGVRPQVDLGQKLRLFLGASGGFSVAQSPTLHQEIALSSPFHQSIQGARSSAFCLKAQCGIGFKLTDELSLSLLADYLHTKPTFKFVRNDLSGSPTESANKRIQTMGVGLGLGYSFVAKK